MARPRRALLSLVVSLVVSLVAALGCRPDAEDSAKVRPPEGALLPAADWRPDALDAGPWPPPEGAEDCAEAAWRVEGEFFEVNTDTCAWTVFSQELTQPVAAGESVQLVIWTDELWAPSPTVATLGLALEGVVVWEVQLEVPGRGMLGEAHPLLPTAAGDGARATLVVQNHGVNNWRVGDVTLDAP